MFRFRKLSIVSLFCFALTCLATDETTPVLNASESNRTFLEKDASSTFGSDDILPTAAETGDLGRISLPIKRLPSASGLGHLSDISAIENLTATTLQPEATTSDILRKWLGFENVTKVFSKKIVKMLLPSLMEGSSSMNISDSCRRDALKFIIGLRGAKTWAFSFIDASAKVIDGMLGGTMSNLGEYDQCLDIQATHDRRGKKFGQVLFTGKYCAIDIKPPLPLKRKHYRLNDVPDELKELAKGQNIVNAVARASQFFHFLNLRSGICVPSGCQVSDLQQVADKFADRTYWTVRVMHCELKRGNEYTPLIVAVMTVLCFFGFLVLVGSVIDLYHRYAQKKISDLALEVLMCFSFPSNFRKLVSTKNTKGPMSCVHGLRVLSISWVVLGHTYLNTNYVLSKSLRKAIDMQMDFFFQVIVNASVAVDTFFFIGGLLVCYVTVKVVKESSKPFSVLLYIMHRLFRLWPVYAAVMAFIYLAPILGSGPVYYETLNPFLDACYKNWWTNLVFLNNFIRAEQICLPQSWYVSCDMQLYIAALVVLVPILRRPWVGLTVASLGMVASVLGTMAMTYFYDYPPTMLFVHPDIEQRLTYWADAYFKPYSHAGPYCIGLVTGYVLATHPKLKFSTISRVIGWPVAVGSNMSVLYGAYEWNKGREPEILETLIYSGLHRVAWTFGVAWVVLNCAAGQGGVVNYILSWRIWIPLGRLTYAIYLIHPIVQIAAVANLRINVMMVHYFIVWIYFGHLLITVGSAFAASMLVEAPFIQLEKLVLRALIRKPSSAHGYANGNASLPNHSTDPESVEESVTTEGKFGTEKVREEPVSHL